MGRRPLPHAGAYAWTEVVCPVGRGGAGTCRSVSREHADTAGGQCPVKTTKALPTPLTTLTVRNNLAPPTYR